MPQITIQGHGTSTRARRACIIPKMERGGPATFLNHLSTGLRSRGIEVTHDLDAAPLDAVLVINGTRYLHQLWEHRRRGVRIVQRLGIPNAYHRPLLTHCHLAPLTCARNVLTRFIRNNLADHIIYQSRFAADQWQAYGGEIAVPSTVIHNGVDLQIFSPTGSAYQREAQTCIINVEGTQGADPFEIVVNLGRHLHKNIPDLEIILFGTPWRGSVARLKSHSFIKFMGHIAASQLPHYYRGADFFIPTDIWAGCPNSVLESLACGIPILGYAAGVLPELVDSTASRCVPCEGGSFSQSRSPGNWAALAEAALGLIANRDRFRAGARRLAEERYDVKVMVDKYTKVLFPEAGQSL